MAEQAASPASRPPAADIVKPASPPGARKQTPAGALLDASLEELNSFTALELALEQQIDDDLYLFDGAGHDSMTLHL